MHCRQLCICQQAAQISASPACSSHIPRALSCPHYSMGTMQCVNLPICPAALASLRSHQLTTVGQQHAEQIRAVWADRPSSKAGMGRGLAASLQWLITDWQQLACSQAVLDSNARTLCKIS